MERHWHAFAFDGYARPSDREARDPLSATPPHLLGMWFRKPAPMRRGTFTDPGAAYDWLAAELDASPPLPAALPARAHLRAARTRLRSGPGPGAGDVYVGYYGARGGFLVRALLVCPRPGEYCPDPPR